MQHLAHDLVHRAPQVDALIVAIVANYNYSLEKAWSLRGGFRGAGLCDPQSVSERDPQAIGNLMKDAGYDRGGLTYIFSERLLGVMQQVRSGLLDELPALVGAGEQEPAVRLLEKIKGLGPKSAKSAWELMKPDPTR